MKTNLKLAKNTRRRTETLPRTSIKPRRAPEARPLKTILVPTDFSPESRKAVRYAAALAKSLGGKIVLVHVIEPMPYGGTLDEIPLLFTSNEMKSASHGRLKKLCAEENIAPELIKAAHIRNGPAYPEIIDTARTVGADLIVIATHGYNALARVIFGSTAERVVRHAKCPVLVVRENEHDFVP